MQTHACTHMEKGNATEEEQIDGFILHLIFLNRIFRFLKKEGKKVSLIAKLILSRCSALTRLTAHLIIAPYLKSTSPRLSQKLLKLKQQKQTWTERLGRQEAAVSPRAH